MTQKFRILSINGGGIRGVFPAALLGRVEDVYRKQRKVDGRPPDQDDRPLARHFDLICGTSTGGLIALGLGLGKSAAEIRDFYLNHGDSIFPNGWLARHIRSLFQIVGPKYDHAVLEKHLKDFFRLPGGPPHRQPTLGASSVALLIPSARAVDACPTVLKTRHRENFVIDHRRPAWRVGLATAAAPVYFKASADPDGNDFIDGGIWANCPVLVGVVEAMSVFGQSPGNIEVLSIGTTRPPASVAHSARRGGAWQNLSLGRRATLELTLNASQEGSMYMAQLLVGESNILHIDHCVGAKQFPMDDSRADKMRDLSALGESKAQQEYGKIYQRFLAPGLAQSRVLTDSQLECPEGP